jgi:hypothetical protein
MDFDILVPGHGPLGGKQHVRMFREYMEDLRAAVGRLLREGKSVDEVKQLVKLPKYESWTNYKEWLGLNAEGMYQHLEKQTPEAPRRREDPDVPPHR